MGNARKFGGTVVMIAGLLLVTVLTYFRSEVLGALGYEDAGTPKTMFIICCVIVWLPIGLIAHLVDSRRSDAA